MVHGAWCIGNQKPAWSYLNRIADATTARLFYFLLFSLDVSFHSNFTAKTKMDRRRDAARRLQLSTIMIIVSSSLAIVSQRYITYTTSYLSRFSFSLAAIVVSALHFSWVRFRFLFVVWPMRSVQVNERDRWAAEQSIRREKLILISVFDRFVTAYWRRIRNKKANIVEQQTQPSDEN